MSLHKQGRSLEELRTLMHTEREIIRHAFEMEIKNIDLLMVSVCIFVYYCVLLPERQL